jgi:hypothetical protein
MDALERKWYGSDMRKVYAEPFKEYLREQGLKFEPSENGEYVHFEVYMTLEELRSANIWVDRHVAMY